MKVRAAGRRRRLCRVAFRSPGAWAEYAAVPVEHVHIVPTELSDRLADEVVCQFPLNPLTARGLQHEVVCDGADNTIKKRGSYGSAAYAGAELHETVIERLPL
jgi:NADPH:quinone reductase-like Zn-dependent oxidoreductase